MSRESPDWVVHATLSRPKIAKDGPGVVVGGVLVLSEEAPPSLRRHLLVDGTPVPARWELPSPQARARFPEAANANQARFRSDPLPPLGQRIEVVVEDPVTGTRLVAAERFLPSGPSQPVPEDATEVRRRVDTLVAGSERDETEYDALRAGLDRVGEADRDPGWLEAAILVEGAFRMRPRVTFQRLGELRQHRLKEGQAATFDDFHANFQRLLAPYTLNSHGYEPALASMDPHTVWEGVEAIRARLADLGYECFANSGTLLGLVRDGRLISHDDDLDLAVVMHASGFAGVADEWVALRRLLADARVLDEEFEAGRRTHCKIRLADGTKVDLFPAWLSRTGQVYVWPHTPGTLLREDLLPLERLSLGETEVAVPHRPARLLEANYGPEWRTPDPTWSFDWPAAKQRFPEFVAAMAAAWGTAGSAS
jgi:hypothetical protein